MKSKEEIYQGLRDWILKTNGKITPEELKNDTQLIKGRIITSLQALDFILYIEEMTGKTVPDINKLTPHTFRTVDSIYEELVLNME